MRGVIQAGVSPQGSARPGNRAPAREGNLFFTMSVRTISFPFVFCESFLKKMVPYSRG